VVAGPAVRDPRPADVVSSPATRFR
jgi:hypothetical protein